MVVHAKGRSKVKILASAMSIILIFLLIMTSGLQSKTKLAFSEYIITHAYLIFEEHTWTSI